MKEFVVNIRRCHGRSFYTHTVLHLSPVEQCWRATRITQATSRMHQSQTIDFSIFLKMCLFTNHSTHVFHLHTGTTSDSISEERGNQEENVKVGRGSNAHIVSLLEQAATCEHDHATRAKCNICLQMTAYIERGACAEQENRSFRISA